MHGMFRAFFIGALAIVFLSSSAKAEDEPFLTLELEVFAKSEYSKFKSNKALSVGPNGRFFYSYDYPSHSEARKRTLAYCDRAMAKDLGRKKPGGWCKLYAVNGNIVWKGLVPGIGLDQELPLPDLPLANAQVYGDGATASAILLYLHGCDRPQIPAPDWVASWFGYFVSRNFLVIAPNSFADPHPELCGDEQLAKPRISSENVRLRVAQAKRSLKELRRIHPGKPIYIWGHSQGSFVAQLFSPDVKGVIASGEECGIGLDATVVISSSVPILYIFGEKDPILELFGKSVTEKSVKARCKKNKGTGERRWVIVKDADHYTAIWHQNLIDSVSKFLGKESFDLRYEKTSINLPEPAKSAFEELQKNNSVHRAFAVGENGNFGSSSGMSNEIDAIQDALRKCEFTSGIAAYTPGESHTCKIYDFKAKQTQG